LSWINAPTGHRPDRRDSSVGAAGAPINPFPFIPAMSRFDAFDIDGRLLQLLVAVVEEASITRAAERLGVTQSAVSHLLDKLRVIVGDPLVVRCGRGIVATARARALARRASGLLDELRAFAAADGFDPAALRGTVTIAANDLQRDLLLPRLLARLRLAAPGLALRVIPSGLPSASMLRDGQCELLITPRPPDAGDVLHRRLFEDDYRVFFDPACRAAPTDAAEYLRADHVTVLYEARRRLHIDDVLAERGVQRRFVAEVPGFAGIAPFLRGSERLATLPGLLRVGLLNGFAHAAVPLPTPSMPMYVVWHLRHQTDPMQRWLREQLDAVVQAALAEVR
jgi:DNA-binding transcriptional LysR family regulator